MSKKLAEVMRGLDLDKYCNPEQDTITSNLGWRAHDGWIFMMIGQFVIEHNQSDNCWDNCPPMGSKEWNEETGEENHYDFIDPPEEFLGKVLSFGINKDGIFLYVEADRSYHVDNGRDWLVEIDGYLIPAEGSVQDLEVEWAQDYAIGVLGLCKVELVPYEETKRLYKLPPKRHYDKLEVASFRAEKNRLVKR